MSEETREKILSACARVIARDGLNRFRMQSVASEANVSIGLLAYHFSDRDGLLKAALDQVTINAAARARGSFATAGNETSEATASMPGERLYALLAAEFGAAEKIRDGSIAWNELRAAAVFTPSLSSAVARSTSAWQRAVRDLVAEASPSVSKAEAEESALLLTTLVEGLSSRWLTDQLTVSDVQQALRSALTRFGFVHERDATV